MLVEVYFWIFSQNYYPIHQNDLPSVFGAASSPASTVQTKPPKKKHPATVRCFFHAFFHASRRDRREIPITHRGLRGLRRWRLDANALTKPMGAQ